MLFLALPSKYRAQYLQNPLAFKYICSTATSHIMLQSDDNSIYGIYKTQVTQVTSHYRNIYKS